MPRSRSLASTASLCTKSPRIVSGAASPCWSAKSIASRTPKHMPRCSARMMRSGECEGMTSIWDPGRFGHKQITLYCKVDSPACQMPTRATISLRAAPPPQGEAQSVQQPRNGDPDSVRREDEADEPRCQSPAGTAAGFPCVPRDHEGPREPKKQAPVQDHGRLRPLGVFLQPHDDGKERAERQDQHDDRRRLEFDGSIEA